MLRNIRMYLATVEVMTGLTIPLHIFRHYFGFHMGQVGTVLREYWYH